MGAPDRSPKLPPVCVALSARLPDSAARTILAAIGRDASDGLADHLVLTTKAMPVYEYTCGACGKTFEELVRGDDNGSVRCDSCGSDRIQRRPSVFAARQTTVCEPSLPVGGCGRCGDPNGPCSM